MTLYQVQGTAVRAKTDRHGVTWSAMQQVPTFYLDSDVQGIRNEEHAVQVATLVVDPHGEAVTYLTAVRLDDISY